MRKLGTLLLEHRLGGEEKKPVRYGSSNGSVSPMLAFVIQEVQREVGKLRSENTENDEGARISNDEIDALIRRISERAGFELTSFEKTEVLAYMEREEKPFGILQELVDDPTISDIIISDFSKISIQQGRRNIKTDFAFSSQEAFEVWVEKILARAGTSYSTKKPITDGMIGAFARIHAVHRSICDTGPYVTIRLNRFGTVSINDLVNAGLAPIEVLNYLKVMVVTGQTLLIVGEVGTGKTTLARAVAASIPPDESIVVIEDTSEIRLEHPHVRYVTTREANSDGAGRVSPSECIRGGMRMAMNRIIFGEIRDAEAGEAFIDVCASGHPGLSTIHARSGSEAITRLELFLGRAQRGVGTKVLSEQIATAVQAIVFVGICMKTGKRRIMEVKEIGPVADGVIRQRDIFRYQLERSVPIWKVLNRVSAHRDVLEEHEEPVVLSSYPSVLELSIDVLFREAGKRKAA